MLASENHACNGQGEKGKHSCSINNSGNQQSLLKPIYAQLQLKRSRFHSDQSGVTGFNDQRCTKALHFGAECWKCLLHVQKIYQQSGDKNVLEGGYSYKRLQTSPAPEFVPNIGESRVLVESFLSAFNHCYLYCVQVKRKETRWAWVFH